MALKQLTFSAPETTHHVALQKKRRSVDSGALQGSFRVWVGHLLFPELDKIYCEAKEKITIGIRWK
jgi:hypothetical protein